MTVPKKSYFIKESIVIKESGFVMTRIEKKFCQMKKLKK